MLIIIDNTESTQAYECGSRVLSRGKTKTFMIKNYRYTFKRLDEESNFDYVIFVNQLTIVKQDTKN